MVKGMGEVGLEVNARKSVYTPCHKDEGAPDAWGKTGPRWNEGGSFELLGGPLGTVELCENFLDERVAGAKALLTKAGELAEVQEAWLISGTSGNCSRICHLMRVTPPPGTLGAESRTLGELSTRP